MPGLARSESSLPQPAAQRLQKMERHSTCFEGIAAAVISAAVRLRIVVALVPAVLSTKVPTLKSTLQIQFLAPGASAVLIRLY